MSGILLTKDEQEQFNQEFNTNSYISPSTASKSVPLTNVETNKILDEFAIKPQYNGYVPTEIKNMGEDVANNLRQSFMISEQTTPDQAAKDVKMSNGLNIPAEYFMDDSDIRDQVAEAFNNKKSSSINWDGIVKQYPTLSQFLSNPKNMATAKDLIPELAEQETNFNKYNKPSNGWTGSVGYTGTKSNIFDVIKNGIANGVWTFEKGATGLARLPIEALLGEDNSAVKALNKHLSASNEEIVESDAKTKHYSLPQKFLYTGTSGATNLFPSLGIGGIAGSAIKGTGTLVNVLSKVVQSLPFGLVSGGQYAEEAHDEGANLGQQAAYGTIGGLTETLLSIPFIDGYIHSLGAKSVVRAGAKNIFKEFGRTGYEFLLNTVKEIGEEVATSPITTFAKKEIYNKDIPLVGEGGVFDFKQVEQDAFGALAMTTIMHAMGLPVSSRGHQLAKAIIETGKTPSKSQLVELNNIVSAETPEHAKAQDKVEESKNNVEAYKNIGEQAAKSQYLDRLPESWRALAEASTQGGKLENIYIDPESFATTLMQSAPEGTDPGAIVQEVAKELGIDNQLQEATETGKPLTIPYATWLEKTAKTPLYKKLEGDIKFSEEGLTLNQAVIEEERIKKAVEEEQTKANIDNTNHDSIYNDIKDQLVKAGRSDKEAKYDAQVFTARMIAEGARRKVNPLELYMGMMQPEIRTGENGEQITGGLNQINAWHGSPYEFDKFTNAKMGTGEGAQAFGWGLYFAGNKEIAKHYKEVLSRGNGDVTKIILNNKPLDENFIDERLNANQDDIEANALAFLSAEGNNIDSAIKELKNIGDDFHLKQAEFLESGKVKVNKGQLYEVSLNPNEQDFLDWDKPLSQQNKSVQDAISKIREDFGWGENDKDATGKDFYHQLTTEIAIDRVGGEDPQEAASNLLNDYGIPGIMYLDSSSRKTGDGFHNYVIFDDNAINIINKYKQDARANVQINPDKSIITLFSNADASSFLHESSHLFLEDTFRYVKSGQADENYLKDWKILSDWLGIKEDQDKLTTEQQEQFARGFESYLMEGKSPSEGLRNAFAAFRRWLTRIYKSVAGLNVQLSDPVRGVMDRMLATEDEIQEREAINGYLMDFIDEKNATPETIDKLRELKTKAHEMAVEALLRPQMDELKPSREELLQAERERVTPIIEEELAKSPIYQVMEAIKQTFGFNKDVKDLASRYLQNGEITDEGIARWEAIADAFGYSTGDQLAKDIISARNFSDEVNERLAVHMSQFGELKDSPQELQFMAEKALHNDEQLSVLAMEKEILADLINKENAKQNKKEWNMQRARIAAEAARRYARATIADKNYREASAATFYFAAERNAAVKESQAYAKKDILAAAQYAEQRMLNHALAIEALKVRQEVDKAFKYVEKWQKIKRPEIALEHLGQIDHILGRFGLQGPNAVAQEGTLADWIKEREEYDEAAIPDFIADETIQKPYKDLTLAELRDVVNAIKNIETVGRNDKKLLTDEQQRNLDLIVEDLVGSMQQNKKLFPSNFDPNKNPGDSIKHWGRGFVASHQKVEWIVRSLDGYKDQGPVWRYVILPMMRGLDKEYKMRREAGEKLTDIIRNYYGKDTSQLATKKITVPGTEHLFPRGITKENVLAMALNWGNEGNRQRLIDSYYDTEMQENLADESTFQNIFDQVMDKNDWDFVQNVWNFIDLYWPQIAQDKKTRTGVDPLKIDASIVKTKYGDYRGGYYPVAYDPSKNEKAFRQAEEESIKELFNLSYLKPSTRRGFEKQRAQAVVGRPLDLHLSVIDNHLATVIHSVSFSNGIRDVDRVLNNGRVSKVIKETMSDEVYKQFRPWLQGIARDNKDMATVGPWAFAENILRRARIGSSVVNMGIKFTTAFSQIAGIIPVMEKLGPARTLGGVMDFYYKAVTGKAKDEIDFVFGKSEMMKNRMNNRDRDIRDATRRLIDENKYDEIKDTYFALTGVFDYAVTMPTWIQAYNKNINVQMKSGKTVNDEMAVRYADQIVRDTQGSGDIVNMAGIQRGSEWYKALTQFYSYFSVYANRQIEAFQRAKRNGEYGQLVSFAVYWWFMPALVSELLSGRWGGDDDDGIGKWLLSTILKYPAGAFVLARDTVSPMIDKILGTGRGDVDLVPSAAAFAKAEQFLAMIPKTVSGETEPEKLLKTGFEAGGYWLHYPSRQISTTVGNIYDAMVNGEDFYLRDLVFPKPANRR